MRSRKTQAYLAVVALVITIPLVLAAGNYDGGGSGAERSDPDGAMRLDAASYAADFGVSEEEALRRLRLQGEIGQLDDRIAKGDGNTFGGLWIQHTPDFKVRVAFTEDGNSKLSEYDTSSGLEGELEAVGVGVSVEALLAAQADAMAAAGRVSQATESDVILVDNRVELYTVDPEGLERALAEAGEVLPANVVVRGGECVELCGSRLGDPWRRIDVGLHLWVLGATL